MIQQKEVPLFEFDRTERALFNTDDEFKEIELPKLTTHYAVICFFREAIEEYVKNHRCDIIMTFKSELVDIPLYLDIEKNILFFQGGVGGPYAVSQIEVLHYLGVQCVVTCGGAGTLQDLTMGHLMIPVSAIRDEGASFHYMAPSYEVTPDLTFVKEVEEKLRDYGLSYVEGKTWTIDSPYRETKDKVLLRQKQGCISVEMECASFFASARFKNMSVASVLYSGDSLTGEYWDERNWHQQDNLRYELLEMMIRIMSDLKQNK